MLSPGMMAFSPRMSCPLHPAPTLPPLSLISLLFYSCLLEPTHGFQAGECRAPQWDKPLVPPWPLYDTLVSASHLILLCSPESLERPLAVFRLVLNSTHTLWFRLNAVIHCSPVPSGKEALLCMIRNSPLHLVTRALCARYLYHRVYMGKQDRPAPCP